MGIEEGEGRIEKEKTYGPNKTPVMGALAFLRPTSSQEEPFTFYLLPFIGLQDCMTTLLNELRHCSLPISLALLCLCRLGLSCPLCSYIRGYGYPRIFFISERFLDNQTSATSQIGHDKT
eukprot:3021581-Pleurochrysis_carterae.AAC.1